MSVYFRAKNFALKINFPPIISIIGTNPELVFIISSFGICKNLVKFRNKYVLNRFVINIIVV